MPVWRMVRRQQNGHGCAFTDGAVGRNRAEVAFDQGVHQRHAENPGQDLRQHNGEAVDAGEESADGLQPQAQRGLINGDAAAGFRSEGVGFWRRGRGTAIGSTWHICYSSAQYCDSQPTP